MSDVSFPHPVLGNGDDVAVGTVDCELTYQTSPEAVELSFTGLKTHNPSIDASIEAGRAIWLVRVQCARTYFRKTWKQTGPEATIRIPGPDLEGHVAVEARLCSTQPLDWQPTGAHADYEDQVFKLADAEVLALGPTWRIHVDKVFDPLKAPVSSWMRIIEGTQEQGPFEVDFEDDLVTIRLSRNDWKEYVAIRVRAPSVLHTSIVLPVLIEAQLRLKGEDDSVQWKSRLQAILDAHDLSADKPLESAQALLDAPLGRALRELNVKLDGEEG